MSTRDARPRRRVVAWATAMALVAVTVAAPARADHTTTAIRDWNLHASNALFNPPPPTPPPTPPVPAAPFPGAGMTPPVGQLHLAIVQGAVYDAVNSIDRGHEPYLRGLPRASRWASIDAAAATAAHHVLVGLRRGNTDVAVLSPVTIAWLDAAYEASLVGIPALAKNRGIAAGAAAAAAMLEKRARDGRFGTFMFTPGNEAGEWRPTPTVSDPNAWVARVKPFVLRRRSQFRTEGPQELTSRAYAREYNEVKEKGSLTGSTRTTSELAIANFYFVNPVELWNRTFRGIALARGLDAAEEARLFAMLNLAGADAMINCWDDKAFWSFWRPVTAIQEGDNDGNRRTAGQTGWTPFLATPPYPDHSSGYNCVTAAHMHSARAFFGRDTVSFDVFNTATLVTRHYNRFTDVIKDTIDARIFQGLHFRAADVQGAGIGKNVARWLDDHYLQPVDDHH